MRPFYHFAPRANWLSDPNGLVHHRGEWHLFYQYNPLGEDWGHMSWGHAVSCDLAQWEELKPALVEDARFAIFSGSAVIDVENSAGFGREAMVALYTCSAVQGQAHQAQCLAWRTDEGRDWQKLGEPVIDRQMADFRDPNVFWHAPSQCWIMVVVLSNENRALLYTSADLKEWTETSEISGVGAPGEVWECPLLIELPIDGGGTRWLFKVDVLNGAPGSGALYRTGSFDGTRFTPDGDWQLADWGSDFYAAIAWHEPRDEHGRPLWIGWMGNHAYQGRLPHQGWRGAMSLPRRIWLRREGKALRLCQAIEASAVRGAADAGYTGVEIPIATRLSLSGDANLLRLVDCDGRELAIERRSSLLRVTRSDAISPFLNVTCEAPFAGTGSVEIWLDAGSVEIFADSGAVSLTMQHRLAGETVTRSHEMTCMHE